jgi:hypothetical protein
MIKMDRIMKIFKLITYVMIAALVAACGSSADFKAGGTTGGTGTTGQTLGSLVTTSSSTSINADGSDSVVITTTASDTTGAAMSGVSVSFSSNAGNLSATSATTDANGQASTTLTIPSGTTGPITIDASSGSISASTLSVAVVNTVPPSIELITDPAQIASNGAQEASITAFVKDEFNNFVEGATVSFSADSGGIQVIQAVTDAAGIARATLSAAGNQQNRQITVTGNVEGVSDTVVVDVIGTTLQVSGNSNIASGDVATYSIFLTNSSDVGIGGETITISSSNGNTLSSTSVVTDTLGRAEFTVTGSSFGMDTISASGFGLTTAADLLVSGDEFVFISPTEFTEIPLNTSQDASVRLLDVNGMPVVGANVLFSTTRGVITSVNPAVTDASGEATVTVISDNSGAVIVLATADVAGDQVLTDFELEFVATTPMFIEVQANPFSVPINETAAITAIVRDPNNNLVKNSTVVFTLDDISGGTLSAGTAVTNSQGVAQIFYTAGSTTSATDGVVITATVINTAIADQVAITASGREVFISMGTGNTIIQYTDPQYAIEYAIQVTDANGGGVAGVPLTLQMLPALGAGRGYWKGYQRLFDLDVTDGNVDDSVWLPFYTTGTPVPSTDPLHGGQIISVGAFPCPNEDINSNAILDPGEDLNGNGFLDPGNIATAVPGNVTTDANGFAYVLVVYPKEFADWADVKLEVQTSVAGTEYTEQRNFRLTGASSDYDDDDVEPPGVVSPYGQSTTCADTL